MTRTRLITAMALLLALTAGLGLTAPAPEPGERDPRSREQIDEARRDLRSLRRLAEAADPDMEELWTAWQRFRTAHAGTPEWREACAVMAGAPSPLDKLDRDQIPEEDRPPWLPKEVVAVLGEHRGRQGLRVREIVVSPDGRWIVSVGDGPDHLWDAATLQLRKIFGASSRFRTFLPDGKSLLTGGWDGPAHLWAVTDDAMKEKGVVKGFDPRLCGARFAVDGETIVTVHQNMTIKLWDMDGGEVKERTHMFGDRRSVYDFSCAARAMTLVDRCGPGEIPRVWDIAKNPPELRFTMPPRCGGVTISPDGAILATLDNKSANDILLWDISGKEPTLLKTLQGHLDRVRGFAFSPDGQTLASVGEDKVLRLWPLTDDRRKALGLKPGDTHDAQAVPFVPIRAALEADNKTAVLAGEDGALRLWDLERRAERIKPRGPMGELAALAFSPDGRTLAAAGSEGVIRLWDLTEARPKERAKLEGHTGQINDLAFSPSGDNLVSKAGSWNNRIDGTTRLWDLKGKEPRQAAVWRPHRYCSCFAYAPNGRLITAGWEGVIFTSGGASVRLWDLAGGIVSERGHLQFEQRIDQNTLFRTDQQADSVTISPRGDLLAFHTENDNLRLYDLTENGFHPRSVLHPFPRGGDIDRMAFSPDGKTLIACGSPFDDDSSPTRPSCLSFWTIDANGAKPQMLFGGKPQRSSRAWTFSPDGKMLAAEQSDTVVVWDVASGRTVWKWETPWGVAALAYSPDGRHLAMATYDGLVYVLRLDSPPAKGAD